MKIIQKQTSMIIYMIAQQPLLCMTYVLKKKEMEDQFSKQCKMQLPTYIWGYDQTNIDNGELFEVRIEITKKTS